MKVTDINLSLGAGFIVFIMGEINTMPGLPKEPIANIINLDENYNIVGLF